MKIVWVQYTTRAEFAAGNIKNITAAVLDVKLITGHSKLTTGFSKTTFNSTFKTRRHKYSFPKTHS